MENEKGIDSEPTNTETEEGDETTLRNKISVGKWVSFFRTGEDTSLEGEVVGWASAGDSVNHYPRIRCGREFNSKELVLNEDYVVEKLWDNKSQADEAKQKESIPEQEKEPIDSQKESEKKVINISETPTETEESKTKKKAA